MGCAAARSGRSSLFLFTFISQHKRHQNSNENINIFPPNPKTQRHSRSEMEADDLNSTAANDERRKEEVLAARH